MGDVWDAVASAFSGFGGVEVEATDNGIFKSVAPSFPEDIGVVLVERRLELRSDFSKVGIGCRLDGVEVRSPTSGRSSVWHSVPFASA